MRTGALFNTPAILLSIACVSLRSCDVDAAPSSPDNFVSRDSGNPLNIEWGPAPSPQDGPPLSAGASRDPAILPAQIGGIVGSYAFTLVLVAIVLLSLSKRRRDHLRGAEELDNEEFVEPTFFAEPPLSVFPSQTTFPYTLESPKSPIRNFSYPSPTSPTQGDQAYVFPSPTSTTQAPGVDLAVDQDVVAADRQMAQQQLEDMYKYVMEQEAAKEAGVKFEPPTVPPAQKAQPPSNGSTTTLSKREKNKPSSLNLTKEEKTQSRTSSILSVLKSPRKKKMQGLSISSPIMTPMSGTFPRAEGEEMNTIPPRHYAPAAPPPVPSSHASYVAQQQRRPLVAPLTPDTSPQSTMSIDERIGAQFAMSQQPGHSRNMSTATTEADPVSATSDSSSTPLMGLPSSPKPGARFSSMVSLPSSPKPGASFSRTNPPSAVRTGGALPLRAYEPSLSSPSAESHQTKQTVFERTGPLSPSGSRTPWTGAPVPYSPYQPFSPVVPMTPSLVTKADRKRMKRFEPKTPTMEMVRSDDEIW